jgi:ATP-binding cassette subfamily F protein uup
MAVLLTCDSLSKSFGSRTVFSDISLSIHDGDHLGIIGPNGAGKSTFLNILGGGMPPDSGAVSYRKGVRMAMVVQDPVFDPQLSVREIVATAALAAATHHDDDSDVEVSKILSRTGFADPDAQAGALSGGWKKRLAIAQALALNPDVLLLDEPTNHLDVEGILWLEKLINASAFASVFVTHDRYFLENASTRVAEINRAYPLGLFAAPGNYSKFLEKRAEFLHAQQKEQDALANLVTREIEWLRRGAKARTSKSKARIQDAFDLQDKLADVTDRNRKGTALVDFNATGRMTKRLVACEGVGKSLGGRKLFGDVTFVLAPGVRMGILGSNGSGKTTLLRILNGEMQPDAGEVRRAEGLRIAYFEQARDFIDPETPLRRALAPEGDTVIFRDRPQHVAGWAARFLFRQEQLDLPVGRLSGGEKARVHIARLMLQPADLLLLDEPTNDLDIPTLEVLESNLAEFPGAIALVTHDRFLLDRLSTVLLAMDGAGDVEFFAELAQWEVASAAKKAPAPKSAAKENAASTPAKKKLSWKEAREWEQMETVVMEAEEVLHTKREQLELPEVVSDPVRLTAAVKEMDEAQDRVDQLYARWAELEKKQAG